MTIEYNHDLFNESEIEKRIEIDQNIFKNSNYFCSVRKKLKFSTYLKF